MKIICVGKARETWWRDACAEYVKRMSRFGGAQIVEVPDCPESEGARCVEKEGASILAALKDGDYPVALCVDGEALSSEGLAARLMDWDARGVKPAFVIGGSLGLSDAVLARAKARLSFSKMTFPHQLMRAILLEQLYRAAKINAGERYHK